ncbi:ankyrin repeat protein [Seminavis robusta]|uniref:Ankyrin repeat protein n=1 Tax=Seminavis robusta TaxID=568900 RepID=A0A9N8D9Q9_9STRA|nr:ankyrin repeat protein [Seminavis robusta]|eukprot:Sro55_g032300.1 ankyrin repeat protein (321) ;mRNA; f:65930-66892
MAIMSTLFSWIAKKLSVVSSNQTSENGQPEGDVPLMDTTEIWVDHIFAFVGMGHYALVAPVNKKMKELYKRYCDSVESPPIVVTWEPFTNRQAGYTDTFYSNALCDVRCAEHVQIHYNATPTSTTFNEAHACKALAKVGNLIVLWWAHDEKSFQWDTATCSAAARGGHLKVLKWARSKGCPWNEWTCAFAAEGGHLEILEWAIEKGCRRHSLTFCELAARNGHKNILRWALNNRFRSSALKSEAFVAEGGHLDLLIWLLATGRIPMHPGICWRAARGGHLEVLQWARANRCPWDARTCHEAERKGHVEILEWARANGCPE